MEIEREPQGQTLKLLKQFVVDNDKVFPIQYKTANSVEEITRHSLLPYLPIVGIAVPVATMLEEAQNIAHIAVPHRPSQERHRGWKSLSIHGISSKLTKSAEAYGLDPSDLRNHHWTAASSLCPATTHFLKHTLMYEGYLRVRLMYLEPGGYIFPHRDLDHYHLATTTIALNNPKHCNTIMENVGVVPLKSGQINQLALVNRHCVWNQSDETRIHLIIHGHPDMNHWNKVYDESYRSLVHGQSATRFLAK